MSKVNKIERIVKRVLAENPITRGDDFVLIGFNEVTKGY